MKHQENMFKHFNDNRFSIVLACRQSGKSISSVVYLLWYACFHPEKTIEILGKKNTELLHTPMTYDAEEINLKIN